MKCGGEADDKELIGAAKIRSDQELKNCLTK
jgi:hypothetical protein